MSRFLAPLVAFIATCALAAQTPYLVKDIKTVGVGTVYDSQAGEFVAVGDAVYFFAKKEFIGRELWKYENGVATMVKDITPSSAETNSARGLCALPNGTLLFALDDGIHGRELWRSDGTEAGTTLVRDINPNGTAWIAGQTVIDGLLYFVANDGVHGDEPWVSDGTEAGTKMVAEINISFPEIFIGEKLNGRILIGTHEGLWSTDGTPEGTALVKGGVSAGAPVSTGTKAYFLGFDSATKNELWVTDGTTEGTQRVIDLRPGAQSGVPWPVPPVVIGEDALFWGTDGTQSGLWRTNGTSGGTYFVASAGIPEFSEGFPWLAVNGIVYYRDVDRALWRSDGTAGGTFLLESAELLGSPVVAFNGAIYYAKSGVVKTTDGTLAGTTTAFTIPPQQIYYNLTFTGGRLYFAADGMEGLEPWVSENGTQATTHLLANVNPDTPPGSGPSNLAAATNQLFFLATDDNGVASIWRTDGTDAGTRKLRTGTTLSAGSSGNLRPSGGSAYWRENGKLWRSDGTEAATAEQTSPPAVSALFRGSSLLYLSNGNSLWRTDGSLAGTYQLDGVTTSLSYGAELAGRLFYTDSGGRGLWRTDGVPGSSMFAGTLPLSGIRELKPGLGAIFISGSNELGCELFRSDGTPEGTVLVKDIVPGSSSSWPEQLTAAGPYVFFVASSNSLWRTDGTPEGTVLLKAFFQLRSLTAVGDLLYFAASDFVHGVELWRSDGTAEGTVMVKDIAAGGASSSAESFLAVDGELWFVADNGMNGRELWHSDGTESGTVLAHDIYAGSPGSWPSELTLSGRRVFFRATDAVSGAELWAMNLTGNAFTISDVRTSEGHAGTKNLRFVVTRTGDTSAAASVSYATSDLSASSGTDYTATSGSLSFAAGDTSKFIDVAIAGDATNEQDESFFVVLSSPVDAAISRTRAIGIIANDDQQVDVGLTILPGSNTGGILLNVINNGPSTATGITVALTVSPSDVAFRTVTFPSLAPGESITQSTWLVETAPYTDIDYKPGYTVRGMASAAETDINLTNNSDTRMTDSNGRLMLPPYLQVSTAGAGIANAGTAQFTTDALLTITPGSFSESSTQNRPITLQAGATPGRSKVTGNVDYKAVALTYPIVAAGQVAKLDTTLSIVNGSAPYGTPLQFQAVINGVRPDGTRPTGVVTFKDNGNGVIAQGTLNANGSVTLTRNGLSAGTWTHWMEYGGDANFNPLRTAFSLTFTQAATTVTGTLTRTSCFTAEGQIIVKAASGTPAPQGTLTVKRGSSTVATFTIAPTANPGEASAMVRLTLPAGTNNLTFYYGPAQFSNYTYSNASQSVTIADCAGFGTSLYVMTPCRIIDTRDSTPLVPVTDRVVQVSGRCNIPATAKAVAANVTVVSPSIPGYLRLLPSGVLPRPSTSTVSYRMNKTRANNTIIMLNSDGAVDVQNGGTNPVHFIIDVSGYYQ